MTNQRKKKKKAAPTPRPVEKYDGNPVLFDVWPWLEANKIAGDVVVTGPFRLANAVNEYFWPAIIVPAEENRPAFEEERIKLSAVLGKEIEVLTIASAHRHEMRFWLSLAVDYFCPLIPCLPPQVKRLAILHDIMSAEGVFGPHNKTNFEDGLKNADLLLCVSETTERRYRHYEHAKGIEPKQIIPFRNCHHFGSNYPVEDLSQMERDPLRSMSLHTLYRRKNIFRTLEVSNYSLCCPHVHYGNLPRDTDLTNAEQQEWANLLAEKKVSWFTFASDEEILEEMLYCSYFICASEDEGFSMPAMEAIICGVPIIMLSDIPVHREIYGDFNVNFFSTKMGVLDMPSKPKRITPEDRRKIFSRHSLGNMISPLLEYVQKHA